MTEKTCKREEWIDICKGIAILLVVVGHSFRDEMLVYEVCYFIKSLIYSFHMPLFMELSGMVFALSLERNIDNSSGAFFLEKAKSLIRPFILYSMILYCVFLLANKVKPVHSILSNTGYKTVSIDTYIMRMLIGDNPYGVHLWYIYSLFIVMVFAYIIIKLIYKANMKKYSSYILVSVALLVWILRFTYNPSNTIIYRTMYYGMFYVIGVVRLEREIQCKKLYMFISLLSWFFLIIISLSSWSITSSIFKFMKIFPTLVVLDNVFFLSKAIKHAKMARLFSYLGRKSFIIYLLHQPFFCAMLGTILQRVGEDVFSTCFICIITSVTVPLIVVYMLRKNRITRSLCDLMGLK